MARKLKYKPRSWSEYNKSLIERGSLSLWINENVLNNWIADSNDNEGAPQKYSDVAITAALQLKFMLNLTFRATQGFLISLFKNLGVNLPVPHYSTFSRRLKRLKINIGANSDGIPLELGIDSSGLKVYGEGEWKVRTHGKGKRRTWRKFHLGIDLKEQKIHAVTVTTNDFRDNEVFDDTIEQVQTVISEVVGDGAYDAENCYQTCATKGIKPIFPPRKGAVIHQHKNCKKTPLPRDEAVRIIHKRGRKYWKKSVNYHRRSLTETAMFRFKRAFSPELKSRNFINQAKEVFIKCAILNKFNEIGLAKSVACW